MSIFMRLLTGNNSTMNDNIQITSGYRADYLYRCRYKDNGELYDKRLMRCRPHDGFSLFKVVGNYPPFIEGWTAHQYFSLQAQMMLCINTKRFLGGRRSMQSK